MEINMLTAWASDPDIENTDRSQRAYAVEHLPPALRQRLEACGAAPAYMWRKASADVRIGLLGDDDAIPADVSNFALIGVPGLHVTESEPETDDGELLAQYFEAVTAADEAQRIVEWSARVKASVAFELSRTRTVREVGRLLGVSHARAAVLITAGKPPSVN